MDVDVDPVIEKIQVADKKEGNLILGNENNGEIMDTVSEIVNSTNKPAESELKILNDAILEDTVGQIKKRKISQDSNDDVNVKKSKIESDQIKPLIETSNSKSISEEADDLLERLDAIDASSLRKPDLKIDEIDTTDLDEDDLLKRLEEAENGGDIEITTSQIDEQSKLSPNSEEIENLEKLVDLTSDTDESVKGSQDPVKTSVIPPDSSTSENSTKDDLIEIQSQSDEDIGNELPPQNIAISIDSSDDSSSQNETVKEIIKDKITTELTNVPSSSTSIDSNEKLKNKLNSDSIEENKEKLNSPEKQNDLKEKNLIVIENKYEVTSSAQNDIIEKNDDNIDTLTNEIDDNNVSTSKENETGKIEKGSDVSDVVSTSEEERINKNEVLEKIEENIQEVSSDEDITKQKTNENKTEESHIPSSSSVDSKKHTGQIELSNQVDEIIKIDSNKEIPEGSKSGDIKTITPETPLKSVEASVNSNNEIISSNECISSTKNSESNDLNKDKQTVSSSKNNENSSNEPDSPTKIDLNKKLEVTKSSNSKKSLDKSNDESLLMEHEAKDLHMQTTIQIEDSDDEKTEKVSNIKLRKNEENEKKCDDQVHAMEVDEEPEGNRQSTDSTVSINSTSDDIKCSKDGNESLKMEHEHINDSLINTVDEIGSLKKDKLFGKVLIMNNGSSTPNSNNVSVTNMEKKFDISSENVSKISENINTTSGQPEDVMMADTTNDYVDSSHADEKSSEIERTGNESEGTDTLSSGGITAFTKTIKELNGMSPNSQTSDDCKPGSIKSDVTDSSKAKNMIHSSNGINLELYLSNETSEECLYEVSVYYEENEMRFLSVEKFDRNKKMGRVTPISDVPGGTDSSGKHSSNGSVGSLGPFTLPQSRFSTVSSNSSSNCSNKENEGKFAIPSLPQKSKQTIKGITSLCNFMIEHFSKIKHNLNPEEDVLATPTSVKSKEISKKNLSKGLHETPESSTGRGGNKKRVSSSDVTSSSLIDDSVETSKTKSSGKKVKSASKTGQGQFLVPATDSLQNHALIGVSVLARWIDKKYYGGKVAEVKTGNKYVIRFEDGALKTLAHEAIVFGNENILPLQDQHVFALVDDDFENGVVTGLENRNGEIFYTVVTSEKTVNVTISDIYLTEDQAKHIRSLNKTDESLAEKDDEESTGKRKTHRNIIARSEVTPTTGTGRGRGRKSSALSQTPEAGFSGGVVPGKKGRRAKRPIQPQSESSDVSDTLESDSAPNSPDSALEAVDGVQPELQKTPKESQINKLHIMKKYLEEHHGNPKEAEDLFGPIPTNKTLFRNKHFILTCTISMKDRNITEEEKNNEKDEDMTNKFRKFSSIPFVKEHLRKQIEEGGGKVYNHFEDVPKNKYKQCKLIAPSPCATAKYVQCLAAEIPAVSHEWIIECCNKGSLVDTKPYALPSGWSIIENRYIKWAIGRSADQRHSSNPLSNQIVLLASLNKEFCDFWSRVCKLSGATLRVIKSASDITQTQSGFMLTDDEFPAEIKEKAEHFGIPVVSTVWVVQSLILGKTCKPDAHKKLTQMYQDDDY